MLGKEPIKFHALTVLLLFNQDTLRDDCDNSDNCISNCCVNPFITPVYFVVFVLIAQFVLVNVVVAVLMKHLEVSSPFNKTARDIVLFELI